MFPGKYLQFLVIVPFVATPLKGQFVVFLRWFLIGYFRLGFIGLGDCPAGLEPTAGSRNRRKAAVKNTKNRLLRSVATKGTVP